MPVNSGIAGSGDDKKRPDQSKNCRHALYRTARESVLHALDYAYRHRKKRKADFRRLWIVRINAAVRSQGMSYSQFVAGLKNSNIEINRKILAEMVVNDPQSFNKLIASMSTKDANTN